MRTQWWVLDSLFLLISLSNVHLKYSSGRGGIGNIKYIRAVVNPPLTPTVLALATRSRTAMAEYDLSKIPYLDHHLAFPLLASL